MSSSSPLRRLNTADSVDSPGSSSPSLQHELRQFDRRHRRSPSNASLQSVASISSTLDLAQGSELQGLTQNAVSSLLSHPITRTGLVPQSALSLPSGHRAPSVRDIPPVHLSPIPIIESSAFKSYLAAIGPLYESYQRSKPSEDDDLVSSPRRESKPDYFTPRQNSFREPQTPLRTPANLTPPQSPLSPRRPPGQSRRKSNAPPSLSTIPNVYFEEDFHLENPRTFDVVSEKSDVIPPDQYASKEDKVAIGPGTVPGRSGRKALHTNAILQEKLSWYMDTVEVHLIRSIATSSSSFFAALGSLKELQSEATESTAKIKNIRSALAQLNQDMALAGLEVVKTKRRRENLAKLGFAVQQLCDVMDEATQCEQLVDGAALNEANARLNKLEDLISGSDLGQTYPLVDLRKLKALQGLSEGIVLLRHRIGKGFETKFLDALLADSRSHVDGVAAVDTLQRWARSTFRSRSDNKQGKQTNPAYLDTNESLKPALIAALNGLNQAGQTPQAGVAYREATMKEIKSLIRKHLPSSSDDDVESTVSSSTRGGRRTNQQEKSAILARNLRNLDPEAAEELLVKVYTSVGEVLRRLGTQVKVVLDLTSNLDSQKGAPTQIRDEMIQALDMSSLLGQAVDVTQAQITKVLKVRSEQTTRLSPFLFLRYFVLNRLFTDECEAVSGRGSELLKEVVNAQVKDFLVQMSEGEKQRVVARLEADVWEPVDFGPHEQQSLDRILESMEKTPKPWLEYTSLWESAPANGSVNGHGDASSKTRFATIEDQSFILVPSTITALHGIETYLKFIAGIPFLAAECSLRLIDYLKTFNSRCCQLILGAGATRSAGLKNITTKHLALASQTCSFLIHLVPYMRESVRRQGGSGNPLVEFDKLKRSIQDHQVSIHDKLVDIMTQRSSLHISAFKKIDWDAKHDELNAYAETLAKETGTLYRVLSRHIAQAELQMIMVPIFAQYSSEWSKAVGEANIRTDAGKQRLLRDLRFLDSRFSKIESSNNFVEHLISAAEAKETEPTSETVSTTTASAPGMVENSGINPADSQAAQVSTAASSSDKHGDTLLAPETAISRSAESKITPIIAPLAADPTSKVADSNGVDHELTPPTNAESHQEARMIAEGQARDEDTSSAMQLIPGEAAQSQTSFESSNTIDKPGSESWPAEAEAAQAPGADPPATTMFDAEEPLTPAALEGDQV